MSYMFIIILLTNNMAERQKEARLNWANLAYSKIICVEWQVA